MNFPLSAFSDLRTTELHPIFQSSFEYTVDNTDLVTKEEDKGGTVTQALGMAVVGTSTTTLSMAMLTSKQRAKYRSGLGGALRFTALFTAGVAATEQYVGLSDKMGSDKATGTVQLTAGASGSVDGITVNSIEIMSGGEAFATDLTVTARAVAANINAHTSAPNYSATSLGDLITITSSARGTTPNGFVVVSATTTITSTDVNLAGGTAGAAFENGYAVGFDGVTFGYHRFQNNVKITTALANWDDPLDGTGESGETIDPTKLNVFFIQYQYLGAGSINICFEKQNGEIVIAHVDRYAGLNTEPSVHNPNFFFHMHADNKATTSNMIIKSSSYAYFVEGKTSFIELHQPSNSSGKREKLTVTTEVAIFTIRNKSTYASKTNFIEILFLSAAASIEADAANNLGGVRVVKNADLGGDPSFADINTTNSVVEIDVAGTTVSNGIEGGGGGGLLAGKNDELRLSLLDSKIILSPGETLTFAGVSVASATIDAVLNWREMF